MPTSLTKTTVALLLAAIAVLLTAGIGMRDFIEDVNPVCPGTFQVVSSGRSSAVGPDDPKVPFQVVEAKAKDVTPPDGSQFRVVYEMAPQKTPIGYPAGYKNVRLEWLGSSTDAPCVCGALPFALTQGGPYGLEMRFDARSRQYSLGNGTDDATVFTIEPAPSHHLQTARIVSRRHLSLAVSFAAFLALGVAWLRQRKARAYALTMHAWREAELTSGQMIQSETGEMLGTLQSSSKRPWRRASKVLVAPEALSGSGLYRDVPAVEPRHVARGGHDEWARATMIRLRDARALAILSTLTSGLALAAHLFGAGALH